MCGRDWSSDVCSSDLVYAERPDGPPVILKLLSEDPAYENAPREGIRRVLQQTGPIDASRIEWIRMGTTVATNGLLEREGEEDRKSVV